MMWKEKAKKRDIEREEKTNTYEGADQPTDRSLHAHTHTNSLKVFIRKEKRTRMKKNR